MERQWAGFIVKGAPEGIFDEAMIKEYSRQFQVEDGDTVDSLLADYDAAARATDELIRSVPDLGASRPLPPAPWFKPGRGGPPGGRSSTSSPSSPSTRDMPTSSARLSTVRRRWG